MCVIGCLMGYLACVSKSFPINVHVKSEGLGVSVEESGVTGIGVSCKVVKDGNHEEGLPPRG